MKFIENTKNNDVSALDIMVSSEFQDMVECGYIATEKRTERKKTAIFAKL